MRLAAALRPDPLGSSQRSPMPLAVFGVRAESPRKERGMGRGKGRENREGKGKKGREKNEKEGREGEGSGK